MSAGSVADSTPFAALTPDAVLDAAEALDLRPDGRLSLPYQITMATAAKLRTADAATVDDKLIISTETALMHLSEAISSTFLGRNEPIEAREELPS